MKYSSTLSSKGQVTVPQEIRTRLGLTTGDRIDFVVEGERTLIRPARGMSNPFEKFRGVLGTFPGGQREISNWIADLRDDESRAGDLRENEPRENNKRATRRGRK